MEIIVDKIFWSKLKGKFVRVILSLNCKFLLIFNVDERYFNIEVFDKKYSIVIKMLLIIVEIIKDVYFFFFFNFLKIRL